MSLLRKTNCLRDFRIKKGLSGYDLQILSSVPAHNIYLIERGIKRPSVHEKYLLSVALGVSEEELFPKLGSHPQIVRTDFRKGRGP